MMVWAESAGRWPAKRGGTAEGMSLSSSGGRKVFCLMRKAGIKEPIMALNKRYRPDEVESRPPEPGLTVVLANERVAVGVTGSMGIMTG